MSNLIGSAVDEGLTAMQTEMEMAMAIRTQMGTAIQTQVVPWKFLIILLSARATPEVCWPSVWPEALVSTCCWSTGGPISVGMLMTILTALAYLFINMVRIFFIPIQKKSL